MAGDEEEQDTRPVGFWHRDLNETRKYVVKKWIITTLILSIAILSILSIYWGVLFHVEQNLSSLVVWVVDFDAQVAPYTDTTPIVGPEIVKAAEALIAPEGALGWGSLPASDFGYDPMEVRRRVWEFGAWAAVIINANATALLQNAVQNGNTTYDPIGIAQIIYVQARDETTYANYITPQLLQFQSSVTAMFGQQWAAQAGDQAATNPAILTNIRNNPQAISPAIGFSTFNLRPFTPPVATPAVSIAPTPVVEASRQLLFDLHSRIGLNFGILFTWVAINTLFFPFCCYFMRWQTLRSQEKTMDKRGNAKEDSESKGPEETG
ncbi:MNNG and nitrosoguanidine resistance protein [Botrytis cinerea]